MHFSPTLNHFIFISVKQKKKKKGSICKKTIDEDKKFLLILAHDKATSPSQLPLMRFLRRTP